MMVRGYCCYAAPLQQSLPVARRTIWQVSSRAAARNSTIWPSAFAAGLIYYPSIHFRRQWNFAILKSCIETHFVILRFQNTWRSMDKKLQKVMYPQNFIKDFFMCFSCLQNFQKHYSSIKTPLRGLRYSLLKMLINLLHVQFCPAHRQVAQFLQDLSIYASKPDVMAFIT